MTRVVIVNPTEITDAKGNLLKKGFKVRLECRHVLFRAEDPGTKMECPVCKRNLDRERTRRQEDLAQRWAETIMEKFLSGKMTGQEARAQAKGCVDPVVGKMAFELVCRKTCK